MGEPKIPAISVKSLNLPPELEPAIQEIASGGGSADLDTVEELNQAALTLNNLLQKTQKASQALGRRVFIREGSNVYDYRIEAKGWRNYLIRKNLRTGLEERIDRDVGGCGYNPGEIVQIKTDGKDVYVVFELSSRDGYFGKIVTVEGKRKIQFTDVSDLLSKKIGDLVIQGSLVYVEGQSNWSRSTIWAEIKNAKYSGTDASCRAP